MHFGPRRQEDTLPDSPHPTRFPPVLQLFRHFPFFGTALSKSFLIYLTLFRFDCSVCSFVSNVMILNLCRVFTGFYCGSLLQILNRTTLLTEYLSLFVPLLSEVNVSYSWTLRLVKTKRNLEWNLRKMCVTEIYRAAILIFEFAINNVKLSPQAKCQKIDV